MDVQRAFRVLKLDADASREEVIRSYKHRARLWHPDRFQKREVKEKAARMLKEIIEARRVLFEHFDAAVAASKPAPPTPAPPTRAASTPAPRPPAQSPTVHHAPQSPPAFVRFLCWFFSPTEPTFANLVMSTVVMLVVITPICLVRGCNDRPSTSANSTRANTRREKAPDTSTRVQPTPGHDFLRRRSGESLPEFTARVLVEANRAADLGERRRAISIVALAMGPVAGEPELEAALYVRRAEWLHEEGKQLGAILDCNHVLDELDLAGPVNDGIRARAHLVRARARLADRPEFFKPWYEVSLDAQRAARLDHTLADEASELRERARTVRAEVLGRNQHNGPDTGQSR